MGDCEMRISDCEAARSVIPSEVEGSTKLCTTVLRATAYTTCEVPPLAIRFAGRSVGTTDHDHGRTQTLSTQN